MSKNTRLFLTVFILFFLFGWGVNVFEKNIKNFFFWREIAKNPQWLTAEVGQLDPVRKKTISDFTSDAASVISVFINNQGKEITLFEKDSLRPLPIGSLTKLLTAKIILENYNPNQIVQISQKSASFPGNGANKLKVGEIFRVVDLLYPVLMESNNTATYALAELMGQEKFVQRMNLEAKNAGMENTQFLNPTGLDENGQYSTAFDLAKLTENLVTRDPFIWNILSLREIDLYSAQGKFVYTVTTTNELLGEIPSLIGGKTGETPKAGGCLLLVTEAPKGRGYLINVILGSENRFEEMRELLEWVSKAFQW